MFTNLQKINNFNDRCAPRVSTVHFLIFLVETTFKRTKPRTQYVGEKLMSNGVNPVLFYSYLNSVIKKTISITKIKILFKKNP